MTKRLKEILQGVGSVVDVFPRADPAARVRRVHPYPTDTDALRSDWERVGGDMKRAIDVVADEQQKTG
jgi:hypothetical protein